MFMWILRVIALIFLLWFILPIFKGYFNAGNKLGIAMCLYTLLFYTNTPVFEYAKNLCYSYPALIVVWKILACLIYAFIFYATFVTLAMLIASFIRPKKNASAITLGIRADKDGPSPLLEGRIVATKRYLDNNKESLAVLSGGKCKRDYIAESQCMYNTLTDMGVSADVLIIEGDSLSTYENILFSYRILKAGGKEKNLAIVTDRFHQLRARLIVRKLGIKSHVGAINARTYFLYIPTYYVREWIALCYEGLFRFRPHR